jgi:hypothetical protein
MKLKKQYDNTTFSYRNPKMGMRMLKLSSTDSSNYNELLDNGFYYLFEDIILEIEVETPIVEEVKPKKNTKQKKS